MSTYDSLNELTGDANPLEEKPSTFVDMLSFGFCGFRSPDDAGAPSLPFDLGVGFCARDDDDDDALFAGAWESSTRLPGLPAQSAGRPGRRVTACAAGATSFSLVSRRVAFQASAAVGQRSSASRRRAALDAFAARRRGCAIVSGPRRDPSTPRRVCLYRIVSFRLYDT